MMNFAKALGRLAQAAVLCLACSLSTPGAAAQPEGYDELATGILRELISIRSSAAFPENTVRLLEGVAERLRKEGFSDEQIALVPAGETTNLVVRYPGNGERKPILAMAHVDVVDADAEDWQADPFTLTEIDGYYYGRGTTDNKTGAAALILAFIRMKREGYLPDRDLVIVLTGDEESSSKGIALLAGPRKELIDAELALNTDAGGGVLGPDGEPRLAVVQMSEKLYQTYEFEVTNRGGHSSLPRPDNAIYRLARALGRLDAYRFPIEIGPVVRERLRIEGAAAGGESGALMLAAARVPPDLEAARKLAAADPFFNASFRTTCVATMLASGVAENALPRSATAAVNCRILPGVSPDEVLAVLREVVADDGVSIRPRIGGASPSPPSPLRDDVLAVITKLTREFWGDIPVAPAQSTGATDGLWVRKAGIPVYGFSAIFEDPGDVRAHGLDERIGVEAFHTAVRVWYRMLRQLSE